MVVCLVLAGCAGAPANSAKPGVEILDSRETTAATEILSTEPDETSTTAPEETTEPTEEEEQEEEEKQEEEDELPENDDPDMIFTPVDEKVTAKIEVNLRSIPSQGEECEILHTLENGETVKRTGISDSGWSELTWKGKTCYAVSSYLTTDLDYKAPVQIQTPFTKTDELVTPKEAVNLRTLPSTKHPDVEVVVKLEKGETVKRTGINEDVGWSRVEWNGQTLYCISSYLRIAEETTE